MTWTTYRGCTRTPTSRRRCSRKPRTPDVAVSARPTRRVLGIDPGLAVTGYGIIDGDGVVTEPVAAGVLRTRAKDSRAKRLAELFERIGALIDEHRPDDVAIEQHFVAENVRSAMVIGEA